LDDRKGPDKLPPPGAADRDVVCFPFASHFERDNPTPDHAQPAARGQPRQSMPLDLNDTERAALIVLLRGEVDNTRYSLAPRVKVLRGILAKFGSAI